MTGKQEGLADAVARNANAVGSRRAGRAPEPLEARADGVAVGRVVVAVDVVGLGVAHIGGRGGADHDDFPRKIGLQVEKKSASQANARAALRYAANLLIFVTVRKARESVKRARNRM